MGADPFENKVVVSRSDLERGLIEKPLAMEESVHREIVQRVLRMYQAATVDQKNAGAPYQTGGEWASYLAERQDFYEALMEGDAAAATAKLRNFWRNELGPIVKEYARFEQLSAGESEASDRFCRNIGRNYAIWKEITAKPATVLKVPPTGNAWGCMIDGEMIVPKACRYYVHSQMLANLTAGSERGVVAEIGAGYGGAAYFLLRDTNNVTYIDFDLPETLVLAAYYILCAFPEKRFFLYGEGDLSVSGRALEAFDALFLPNFYLPLLADRSVDVFFNSFSLSEMPYGTLAEYLSQIKRASRGYFLHNNVDRSGVVNRGFERIPCSDYPIDENDFALVYKHFDLFHGQGGDYREVLYRRRL